jgi:hypothetical protein
MAEKVTEARYRMHAECRNRLSRHYDSTSSLQHQSSYLGDVNRFRISNILGIPKT